MKRLSRPRPGRFQCALRAGRRSLAESRRGPFFSLRLSARRPFFSPLTVDSLAEVHDPGRQIRRGSAGCGAEDRSCTLSRAARTRVSCRPAFDRVRSLVGIVDLAIFPSDRSRRTLPIDLGSVRSQIIFFKPVALERDRKRRRNGGRGDDSTGETNLNFGVGQR